MKCEGRGTKVIRHHRGMWGVKMRDVCPSACNTLPHPPNHLHIKITILIIHNRSILEMHAHSPTFVTSPTSQLILQPFLRFTYVTAHSPTLPLLHLRHSSFFNPSFASPTSQDFHLRRVASRPCSTDSNRIPFNAGIILENRKKISHGARSGEHGGCSITGNLCLARNFLTVRALCTGATL